MQLLREKRTEKNKKRRKNRLSHSQKLKQGITITKQERSEMFEKAIQSLSKSLEIMEENIKSKKFTKKYEEIIFKYQKELLLTMTWSCGLVVVQRREVMELLTISNILFHQKEQCFCLVIDIAEKADRSIRTEEVPLLFPRQLTQFIRFWVDKLRPKLIKDTNILSFWIGKRTKCGVSGSTLNAWLKESSKDIIGKQLGFLESRHTYATHAVLESKNMSDEEKSKYFKKIVCFCYFFNLISLVEFGMS